MHRVQLHKSLGCRYDLAIGSEEPFGDDGIKEDEDLEEDLLADDLEENLETKETPAEATAATESAEAKISLTLAVGSSSLLLASLSSLPAIDAPKFVSFSGCTST